MKLSKNFKTFLVLITAAVLLFCMWLLLHRYFFWLGKDDLYLKEKTSQCKSDLKDSKKYCGAPSPMDCDYYGLYIPNLNFRFVLTATNCPDY
jgi:hypothetical protein